LFTNKLTDFGPVCIIESYPWLVGLSVNQIVRRLLIDAVTVTEMEVSASQIRRSSTATAIHLIRILFCPYVTWWCGWWTAVVGHVWQNGEGNHQRIWCIHTKCSRLISSLEFTADFRCRICVMNFLNQEWILLGVNISVILDYGDGTNVLKFLFISNVTTIL
jgi:hypothetical protein